jgi:hypothetical protein
MHTAVERQVDDIHVVRERRTPPYGTKGGRRTKRGPMPTGHGQIHKKKWILVGMYTANYPSPPPPTPWYPPQPPTTSHRPRRHRFRSERPRPRYQRDEYRPPRPRRVALPNPPSNQFRRVYGERGPPPRPNHPVQPRYVPPHLRTTSPGNWRERPPHPHPSHHVRSRSDSPNWREAHPGRPTSFKSPPPSPSPSPPNPLPAPQPPSAPSDPTPTTHDTSDLSSLIKEVTSALRTITSLAQKLIRRANAERRIAHKTQLVSH